MRVAVVTGTRADYGLLHWLMRALAEHPDVKLDVVVTGSHLSPALGHTVDAIERDGFDVSERVHMVVEGDVDVAVAKSLGLGTVGFADLWSRLRPDRAVVLGDRYEILAAAQSAFLLHVPVVHLHGGEVTEGSLDDGLRNAITMMSSVHLVSAREHGERVVAMGRPASTVHVVGAPGLENLARLELDSREAFERRIGRPLGSPTILLSYHPATDSAEDPERTLAMFEEVLFEYPQALVIATGSNADAGGVMVTRTLAEMAVRRAERMVFTASLGQVGYLSAMRHGDVIVGNSSSGIIEAPSAGMPTVNVGERQRGRMRADSVFDCAPTHDAVREALRRALDADTRDAMGAVRNPYAEQGLDIARRMVGHIVGNGRCPAHGGRA